MAVVEIAGLRKAYPKRGFRATWHRERRPAVDGLDLVVHEGGVHGFLGPNGSGKTTTLRVLLGLVRADAGQVSLLGRTVPQALAAAVGEVGALIEAPQFFPNFSGRRNLSLLAGVAGLPATRVEEVLEIVGLSERAEDRVTGYSLGMRQRLGIAGALLKTPRLLVLDEPTNGLDPAGIREIRELLRSLGSAGTTVLLSSHLLAEVEQVCDTVTIIAAGRRITSGTVADVVASRSVRGSHRAVVTDASAGLAALTAAGVAAQQATDTDGLLTIQGVDDPARISQLLAAAGVWVRELSPQRVDLEDVFLELTEGTGRGAP